MLSLHTGVRERERGEMAYIALDPDLVYHARFAATDEDLEQVLNDSEVKEVLYLDIDENGVWSYVVGAKAEPE